MLVDGAQGMAHRRVDVQALGVDFYTASAHKMYAPTGIGLLYGKTEWLEKLPPYQGGGEMIATVTMGQSTYAPLPFKFEAGTPSIEAVVGWGAAMDWVTALGMDAVMAHESELMAYGTEQLTAIEGLVLFGTTADKAAVLSFGFANVHPYDLGTLLDQQGVAVRSGQHCAQPIMDYYRITGTVRASFALGLGFARSLEQRGLGAAYQSRPILCVPPASAAECAMAYDGPVWQAPDLRVLCESLIDEQARPSLAYA
ncbi:MAG: hypothetical protein RL558_204, partial [Bacteroidota bacterium]